MAESQAIQFWNRKKGRIDAEAVYGDFFLRALYETLPGQFLADHLLSKPLFSKVYGRMQGSALSRLKISSFIEKFDIPMEEFEEGPFSSFNQFFIRQFKPGVRNFVMDSATFPAPAEARYFAYKAVSAKQGLPVKGRFLSIEGLLDNEMLAQEFDQGPVLLARLCPVDYHRFHFPDDGTVIRQYSVGGALHSVNPVALKYHSDILVTNERQVSILETSSFGKIAYVEVGALCVGKIIQTHSPDEGFKRGAEKGYFLFGGSTVVVLGQPGKWAPEEDLIQQTIAGRETLVELGTAVGHRI
ncbi:MAG: phosphatidylserine decarboxylase [Bdellovibrio sp.]|nr:phosphatidylserine decarboxylase [Bdellovibrio sp.]